MLAPSLPIWHKKEEEQQDGYYLTVETWHAYANWSVKAVKQRKQEKTR